MSSRVSVGDLFTIPLNERSVALGQVVGVYLKRSYLVDIFDGVSEPAGSASKRSITSMNVVIVALTLDAKFRSDQWRVIGRAALAPGAILPAGAQRPICGCS